MKKLVTAEIAEYTANGTVWLRAWVAAEPVSETIRFRKDKIVHKVVFYVCSEDGTGAKMCLLNADFAKVCEAAALHADILIGPLKTKQVDVTHSVTGIEYESWEGCNIVSVEPFLGQNEAKKPTFLDLIPPSTLAQCNVNAEVCVTGVIASVEEPTGEYRNRKRRVIILCQELTDDTDAKAGTAQRICTKVRVTLWGIFVQSILPSHVSCSAVLRHTKVQVHLGYSCLSTQATSAIYVPPSEPWFNVFMLDGADAFQSWNTYKIEAARRTTLQQVEQNFKDGSYWAPVILKKMQYDNYIACNYCHKRLHATDFEGLLFCSSFNAIRYNGKERARGTIDAIDCTPGMEMNDDVNALKDAVFQLKKFSPLVEKMTFMSSAHGLTPLLLRLRLSDRDGGTSAVVEHVQYLSA